MADPQPGTSPERSLPPKQRFFVHGLSAFRGYFERCMRHFGISKVNNEPEGLAFRPNKFSLPLQSADAFSIKWINIPTRRLDDPFFSISLELFADASPHVLLPDEVLLDLPDAADRKFNSYYVFAAAEMPPFTVNAFYFGEDMKAHEAPGNDVERVRRLQDQGVCVELSESDCAALMEAIVNLAPDYGDFKENYV